MSDSEARFVFVGQLGEEFLERHRSGEKPPLSEYTEKYPEYADEIREVFPTLLKMEDLAPSAVEEGAAPHDGSNRSPPCGPCMPCRKEDEEGNCLGKADSRIQSSGCAPSAAAFFCSSVR